LDFTAEANNVVFGALGTGKPSAAHDMIRVAAATRSATPGVSQTVT
jgi:hypothetical protein